MRAPRPEDNESLLELLRRRGLGLALVLAAPVGVVFVVLFLVAGDDGGGTVIDQEGAFYIEGSVLTLGPAPVPGGERPEVSSASLRWWYASPELWRWELETTADSETTTQTGVADGDAVWVYDGALNVYYRFPRGDTDNGALPIEAALGAIDTATLVERLTRNGSVVRSGGSSRHLGRDAEVIEFSPIVPLTAEDGAKSPGIGRMWVDDETGLVLRGTLDAGAAGSYVDARVTRLDLSPRLERSLFRFEPPSGATEVKPAAR